MRFNFVRWKNFLSTGDVFTEINLNDVPTSLIIGKNGAGKSTFLDAICFGLFGKPFRKIAKTQLPNSINNKDTLIEISFDIGEKNYLVRRGIKPNIFQIFENGVLLDQDAAVREYQDYFERNILKMNMKAFLQVVVIGSASYTQFMELPTPHRREVIEDLLDLKIFSTMNTILKDKISANKTDLTSVDYDITMVKQHITLLNEAMDRARQDTDTTIMRHQEKIDDIKVTMGGIIARVNELNGSIETLKASNAGRDAVENSYAELLHNKSELIRSTALVERELKFFVEHDDCPTCKRDIDNLFKNEMVDVRRQTIAKSITDLQAIDADISKCTIDIERYKRDDAEINKLTSEVDTNMNELRSNHKVMESVEAEIKRISETPVGSAIDAYVLGSKEDELSKLLKKKEICLANKELYEIAAPMLKDGGIKAKVISQYIPIINQLINKYLSSMDFFVNFELDEEFNETIRSRYRDDFTYASFSEGEKMRIDLALMFAWRDIGKLRNSTTSNLLILDEIFDGSLDDIGTDDFMKILKNIDSETNTFIISHNTNEMVDKFHNVIRFEKHKSFSRIVQ